MNDQWLAGFFDGEGCITSKSYYSYGKYIKQPRVVIQITITQKDRTVLDEIQKVYGGAVDTKHDKKRFCHSWRVTGKENMKRFLTAIYPYSIVKKEQILLALQFIETIREDNLGCVALDDSVHLERGLIHNKLKLLKKAGEIVKG